MGTVLWTNTLINGDVSSDGEDKYALYKFSKKLDQITKKLGVINFLSMHDFTDVQFNLSKN